MKFTPKKGKKPVWALTSSEKHSALKMWEKLPVQSQNWYGTPKGYVRYIQKVKFIDYISKFSKPPKQPTEGELEKAKEYIVQLNNKFSNWEYFGQYPGAAERYVTQVVFVDGSKIECKVPIMGDHDFVDKPWADVFRTDDYSVINCISNFKYEGKRFRFNYRTMLWQDDEPIKVVGRVDRRAFY